MGIADIMLRELKESLENRGLAFSWSDALPAYLVKKAYSTTYGARNLRRTIQKELEDPISMAIIDSFESPIATLYADVCEDAVKLTVN